MDFLGIKTYLATCCARYKKWLAIVRNPYTNKDLVADGLQIVLIILLTAMVFLR